MPRGRACALFLTVLAGVGCVRREMEILSSPPGATIEYDGQRLAQKTPARFPFAWYGTHEIVVYRDGYHRERLIAHVRPPWYEAFPIDFFAENLYPGMLEDVHTFPFTLEREVPMREMTPSEKAAMKKGLLERAADFRKEARQKTGFTPTEPAEETAKPEGPQTGHKPETK